MGFVLVVKGQLGMGIHRLSENCVSIGKYTTSFGSEASKILTKKFVEVYIDYDGKRIGFKGTDSTIRGFKLSRKDKTVRTSCAKIQNLVERGHYPISIEDDMVVIEVQEFKEEEKVLTEVEPQKETLTKTN